MTSLKTHSELPRPLGFFSAVGVVLGIIIGSGIFRSPVVVSNYTDSVVHTSLLWLVGGLAALLGAMTFAEIATRFPVAGGKYVYLREGVGKPVAIAFGWTHVFVMGPLTIAAKTIVFAEYVDTLMGTGSPHMIAIVTIWVLTVLSVVGTSFGSTTATALTAIKIATLLLLAGVGLTWIGSSLPAAPIVTGPSTTTFTVAMAAVLWSYDGWIAAGTLAGDIREPRRNIPRVLFASTIIVSLLYVAVNVGYVLASHHDSIEGENTIVTRLLAPTFGTYGSAFAVGIVAISILGSTLGTVIVASRITYAMGRDRLTFTFLGRVHPQLGTPHIALFTQAILASLILLFLSTFERIVVGFVFTSWVCYGLSALLIFKVRREETPHDTFKCPLYPITPLAFMAFAAFMVVKTFWDTPQESLMWTAIMIVLGIVGHRVTAGRSS